MVEDANKRSLRMHGTQACILWFRVLNFQCFMEQKRRSRALCAANQAGNGQLLQCKILGIVSRQAGMPCKRDS